VLALVGCAGPGQTTSHASAGNASKPSSAASTPSPAQADSVSTGSNDKVGSSLPAGLFVVLESSTGGSFSSAPDTIAIVGLDGRARAKARFKPRSIPFVGTAMAAIVPPIAHVAAGRAYFIDGDGTVRSLSHTGGIRQETRFPVTDSQQEASFAVSPDGRHLIGAVVTLPPKSNPAQRELSGLFSMDIMTANTGERAAVTFHETWTDPRTHGSGAQFMSWDSSGPVASYPAHLGSVGGGVEMWSGSLVRFSDGRPGSPVAISDRCFMNDMLPDGRYVCTPAEGTIEVHAANGALLWQRVHTPGEGYFSCFLSPDAQRVVTFVGPQVVGRDGSVLDLEAHFDQLGWLDSRTVIGHTGPSDELAYVRLQQPTKLVDLGLRGAFVGSLDRA
jgi:hypothetical protein